MILRQVKQCVSVGGGACVSFSAHSLKPNTNWDFRWASVTERTCR